MEAFPSLVQNGNEMRGTLPVNYQGTTYHIPILIQLLQIPRVTVVPTANMLLQPSIHLDASGVFYHPYLNTWNHQSTLPTLLRHMQSTFSRFMPVYMKPSQSQPLLKSTHVKSSPPEIKASLQKPLPTVQVSLDQLKRQVTQKMNALQQQSLQTLTQTIDQLRSSERLLETEYTSLCHQTESIRSAADQLHLHVLQLEQTRHQLDTEQVSPEAVLIPSSPLHKQYFQLLADEQAIEETMYYLSKAFHEGKLDLSGYMKFIRNLASDQFMQRALRFKVEKLL